MNINRCRLTTALTMVMLCTLVVLLGGGTARGQHVPVPLDRSTLTTDQVTIKQGQTARLEVENTGDQSFVVLLLFRDSEGKVLIQRDVTIKAGANEALTYSFTEPNNPLGVAAGNSAARIPIIDAATSHIDVQALFGTEAKLAGFLQATLRIMEKGQTVRLLGPEGFNKSPSGPLVGRPNSAVNPKGLGDQGFPTGFTTPAFSNSQIGLMRLTLASVTPESKLMTPESKLATDLVVLRFVDNDGKVLAYQVATVSKGHDAVLLYTPDPLDPAEIKAQFGSNDKRSLLLIRPTLEIIDSKTKSVKTIGQEGFTQIGIPFYSGGAKP